MVSSEFESDNAAQISPVEMAPPHIMVIFGASGDLTRRKLMPAIYSLYRDGLLPEQFAVLGLDRQELNGWMVIVVNFSAPSRML